jgi:hypothetical protein
LRAGIVELIVDLLHLVVVFVDVGGHASGQTLQLVHC